jgi:hypothetical protein
VPVWYSETVAEKLVDSVHILHTAPKTLVVKAIGKPVWKVVVDSD